MSYLHAWCECGHHANWHKDGGPCTYWATRMQDGDIVPDVCDDACKELRLEHIEVRA